MAEFSIRCANCSAQAAPGTVFCGVCGSRMPEQAEAELVIRCPNCSAQVSPETAFCGNCGRQTAQAMASAQAVPPALPRKTLKSPGVSVGGCENCGSTDLDENGSCRACHPSITERALPVSTPPRVTAAVAHWPESTVAFSGKEDPLRAAAAQRLDHAMAPDPSTARPETAPDPTLALEYIARTAPRPVRQQDSMPPPPHRVDDRRKGRSAIGKVAIVAVPLLVGALGVGYGLTRSQDNGDKTGTAAVQVVPTTSSAVAPAAPPSPPSASPVPVKPAPPPAKARPTTDPSLVQLQALVRGDASLAASKLDGRWVAFLSSKTAGTIDPLQTTESGSHKFGWSDILSEHERFREDPQFSSQVFLIMSTTFGAGTTVNGKPLFVTAVDNSFLSAADVRSWCDMTFAELPTAERNNTCTAAQLTPRA